MADNDGVGDDTRETIGDDGAVDGAEWLYRSWGGIHLEFGGCRTAGGAGAAPGINEEKSEYEA